MAGKPTYEELERRVKELEREVFEHKKDKMKLQEQRELLEMVLSATPDLIVLKDSNSTYKAVNPAFCNFLGKPEQEIIGKTDFDLFPSSEAEMYRSDDARVIETGEPQVQDEEVTGAGGKKQWLQVVKTPIFDKKGRTKGVLCSVRDVTERKQAEKTLRESEEKYRGIFDESIAPVYLFDDKKNFLDSNQAGLELLGYSREELLNMSIPDVDADPIVVLPAHEQLLSGDRIINYEHRLKRKDGKVIAVLNNSRPITDTDGHVIGMQSTLIDITERKRVEEALRESEGKYRSMMEAMDDAAYICSPGFRIEYMNPAMTKKIGYDATGEPCHKVMHGLDEKCPWCIHGKVMKGEYVKTEVVSPKNGKTYHVSNSPIFHTDGSISKLTIFRDVTETKKMEEQLQQVQKMESIGTLAGGIAHDFNNILVPIIGYAELSIKDAPKETVLYKNLQEILTAGMRVKALVKQILTFSRQSDKELKPLRVQTIIKEVLKLSKSTLPSTIEIRQYINNTCGLVMADPTQIHQVAMNLITNAFHAMEDEGGKLEVTLKEVELELDDLTDQSMTPGAYVCLTVTDTGPGMDQSVISRIFEPYFTTKKKDKGTGLGLAVVHGIVKSFNGEIKVYSEPGKGTAFHVYLPVIKTQVETEETETVTPVLKGTERILLVDDEEPIVRMEKQTLEQLGYQVTARTSSPDALEAFRASPDKFDLVITDMTMPNMTGIQLSQKLLEIRPDIPIIICTGFSTKIDDEKAKRFGIRGFAMKPVVMSELAKKIREALDQE